MRHLIAAAAVATLSGCAIKLDIPAEQAFTPAPTVPAVAITWIAADDPTAECKRLWPERMGMHPLVPACAGWNHQTGKCTVVTGKPTTHQILGHEIRHCFEGVFHP